MKRVYSGVQMSLTAEAIVELFERDVRARKRLAELLVSEPDVRLAIINAVLRDVATKGDIERIRAEYATREDVKALRDEVEEVKKGLAEVRERLAKLEGVVSQLITRIDDLKIYVDSRISDLDKRIDALDKRMDSLDKRLDYVAKVSWTLTVSVIAALIANIVLIALRIPR